MLPLIAASALTAYTQPVTALSLYGGSAYVGRADGGVDRVGSDLQVQGRLARAGGVSISFIAASPYGIAWLSGPGGVIRDSAAPGKVAEQRLTIQSEGQTITVSISPSAPVRRLSWVAGRLAVSGDFSTQFFDTRGKVVEPSGFMPAEAAAMAKDSALWVREQDDGTELVVFGRPYSVRQNSANQKAPIVSLFTAYQVGAWQWAKLGGFASNALDAFPDGELKINEEGRVLGDAKFLILSERVGLAPNGIVAREPTALAGVPIYERNWEIGRLPAATIPGDALWFGASESTAWWWNGKSLVQEDRASGSFAAYLPWSDDKMSPTSFAPDPNGIWIGSSSGLRHLTPNAPDASIGYAGFVRAPFGAPATASGDGNAQKLTDAVFAWRFAGEDKAGPDGGMMISSIFSVLGLSLPTTAEQLAGQGTAVVDELRFGDVIVTARSAVFYLGNGITAEVRDGKVQNGDLWRLARPRVRRMFP